MEETEVSESSKSQSRKENSLAFIAREAYEKSLADEAYLKSQLARAYGTRFSVFEVPTN